MINLDLKTVIKIAEDASDNLPDKAMVARMSRPDNVNKSTPFMEDIARISEAHVNRMMLQGFTEEEALVAVVGNLVFGAMVTASNAKNRELGVFFLAASLGKIAEVEAFKNETLQ